LANRGNETCPRWWLEANAELLKYPGIRIRRGQCVLSMYLQTCFEANCVQVANVKLVDMAQEVPFVHTIKAESVIDII
jgi:hypothetical protein